MLPKTGVAFHSADPALQKLFDTAAAKAKLNLQQFGPDQVLVEGGGYEKIWLETQPMGGEMYAKHNMTAALNNQLLFMRTQREDGRLPGSIQCMPDGSIEPQFNKFQGFCFPWPALNMYYWAQLDEDYLRLLAHTLEAFDAYLWRVRDSDGDGCLETWCVYDTGEDNALRYGNAPVYCTEDVPPEGCDVVPIASMDIMSFSYACRDTRAQISRLLKDGQEGAWQEKAQQVADAMKAHLWNEERGACFDHDKNGREMPTLLHNNLRCMYWGSFSQEMADRFVREHLMNPAEFMTPCPLPSVAANDPLFRNAPENNWSGQSEGLTYQRAPLALERYGYEKVVTKLGHALMDVIIRGGYVFTQQFDPFTGEPSRVLTTTKQPAAPGEDGPIQDSYGPTILAVLEYMAHIWGVDQRMGEIWFSLGSAPASYTYEQTWGEHVYRVESTGSRAKVFIDGTLRYEAPCGMRIITDTDGTLIRTRPIE